MRSWSIPVGRLFGVDVRIHLTFIILPMFIFWTDYLANDGKANGSRDLALAGIILSCVAAHEWGHILMARRFGLTPKGVILLPLTGVTLYDETVAEKLQGSTLAGVSQEGVAPAPSAGISAGLPTWKREIVIAAVGPLVSLALASVAIAVVMGTGRGADLWKWPFLRVGNLPCSLVWANLYLAILNLMPAHPLDGGRILRAVFSRTMGASAATRRAVSISNAIAMVLIFAGLVSNNWLTMVGIVVFSAAQLEERALVFQWVLDNVRLEEVMLTDFATLSPADTLEDALEKAVHSLQDDFPVVRGSDMVGVISKQRILEALRAEGNGYVQAVMNKIFEISVRQDSLGSAFSKLTARSSSVIPIVEDQRLVGIVTLQNLMHSTALLAESRKLRRDEGES
jgi:Zn-dependent protease/CBS domain-containing protein